MRQLLLTTIELTKVIQINSKNFIFWLKGYFVRKTWYSPEQLQINEWKTLNQFNRHFLREIRAFITFVSTFFIVKWKICMATYLYSATEGHDYSCRTFQDFSKAFDTVNQNILQYFVGCLKDQYWGHSFSLFILMTFTVAQNYWIFTFCRWGNSFFKYKDLNIQKWN